MPSTEPDRRNRRIQPDIETGDRKGRLYLIVDLALPTLAEGLLSALTTMVDMVMVATMGTVAINAVGLCTQPRLILVSVFLALGIGSTALGAHSKGARDQKAANLVFNQTVTVTMLLCALSCIILYFATDPLIRLIAGQEIAKESVSGAITYLKIQIVGFPTLALTFAITAVLKGVGNTRASFTCNTLANIANIFFNYCLIGGNLGFPKMGVAGASLATVIGQLFGMLLAIWIIARRREYIRFSSGDLFRLDFPIIRRMMRIGVPTLLEQLVMRAGVILFTRMITALGDVAYASFMVTINFQQLIFTVGMALSTSSTTLTGQSLGRKRPDLARTYVRSIQLLGLLVSGIILLTLLLFRRNLIQLYTSDEQILSNTANMLLMVALYTPLINARFINLGALRGAGDARYTAFITILSTLVFRLIIGWLLTDRAFPFQLGLTGIVIAMASDFLLIFVLSQIRFSAGKWSRMEI